MSGTSPAAFRAGEVVRQQLDKLRGHLFDRERRRLLLLVEGKAADELDGGDVLSPERKSGWVMAAP